MTRLLLPVPVEEPGRELRLAWDGVEVVGWSVAALATAFAVPSLGVAVDLGRCSPLLVAQGTVLLTHCHSDHVAGLLAWLSARTRRHPHDAARVVLPDARRDALRDALERWPDLDGVRRRADLEELLIAAAAGDRVDLAGGWARAFAVRHSVPAVGWQLAPAGEERPWLTFAGDGAAATFREQPQLLDARVAVVDCSFVEPGSRVAAHLAGHGHLQDWLELLPDLPCDLLVLAHLPAETGAPALERLLGELPARPAVAAWLPGGGADTGREAPR